MKKSGLFFWGLLIGAAAGAVAGILLAPDKGSVTREKWRQKAADIKEKLDKAVKTGEEVSDQFTHAQDEDADFEARENQG